MPWQFGQLGLTEAGGNRLIKYADALVNGVSAFHIVQLQASDMIPDRHLQTMVYTQLQITLDYLC